MNTIVRNYKYIFIIFLILVIVYLLYQYLLQYYYYYKFKKNGYLLINEAVSDKDCNDILLVINKELGSLEGEFTWNEKNRKNLRVPLDIEIKNIIVKILNDQHLQKIWENFTPNAVLAESSVFLSYPNCQNQPWHRDIKLEEGFANMVTVGIALDDITENMGPLELYPKSMTIPDKDLKELKDKYENNYLETKNYKKRKMTCKKGSIIVWNAKIIHRGSHNFSNTIRPLFYISFLEGDKPKPLDATYSLKSIYKDKIFVNELNN